MPIEYTSDLEDLSELSHLQTTTSTVQENTSIDQDLSPSSLGSSLPFPTPTFQRSSSPSSFCDPFFSLDSESSLVTPDSQSFWPSYELNHQSNESLVSHPSFIPNDAFTLPGFLHAGPGPGPGPRSGPVANKAMLEANARRRRHPAQFKCEYCPQSFTALFSLKREFPCPLLRTSNSMTPYARPHAITHWGASLCMQHRRLFSTILQ